MLLFAIARTVPWTKDGLIQWSTIQIPAIGTSSSTVVSVITKRQGPVGVSDHRCTPSAAALSVSLTLRASFCFLEARATHMDGLGRPWTRSSKRNGNHHPCYRYHHGNDWSRTGLGSSRYTSFVFLGTASCPLSPESKGDTPCLGWSFQVPRFSTASGSLQNVDRCHL